MSYTFAAKISTVHPTNMAEPIAGNTFVIISASNPQAGKKARVRQVRSHITKDYYRRRQEEQQQRRQLRRQHHVICPAPSSSSTEQMSNHSSGDSPRLTPEVHAPIPFTCNPLLDPDFLSAEMTRRVQECEYAL